MKRSESKGIYRRGSIYWLSFQKKGVRQWITLETEDFAEAIRRANEIRLGPGLNTSGEFEAEVERFIAYKVAKKRFTRGSADSRAYVLRAFARWALKPVASVTRADVQQFYDATLQERTTSTANTYARILASFFAWTVNVARIRRTNPCIGLDMARETTLGRRSFCDYELRDRLIRECPRDDLKFVLFCGFHAGLRKNEIIEARPFWFDLNTGLLHLRKTPTMQFKDREERTIPLTQEFLSFLQSYGLHEPFMLAPHVEHGESIYRYDFRRPFLEHVKAVGCPWVTPHIMRHTFASLLASSGVSLFKIAKWLGDDPRVVESRYAKLIPNDPDIELLSHPRSPSPGKSPNAKRSQH